MTSSTFQKIHMPFLMFLLLPVTAWAQFPSLSPRATLTQEIGSTNINIAYERPAMRGRILFGGLVPYGKLWRTGAGNCTTIRFSKPVKIGNTQVPGGTYSLFSIPEIKSWTIILNKDTTLYGLDGYKAENDVVRLTVPMQSTTRHYESLTFDIDVVPNNGVVYISWSNTQVSFVVDTGIDKAAMELIDASLLTGKSANPEEYAVAAEYLYYLDRDLDHGHALITKAISLQKDLWYYRMKMDILEKQKKFTQGIALADEAIQWIDSRQDLSPAQRAEYRGNYERRKANLKTRGGLK